jgi:cell volume regulation protein A
MFLILGLLADPSRLIAVAPEGLLVAFVLTFLARPVAVHATLIPLGFRASELAFLSWAGLKGAIPIILVIIPVLEGVPDSLLLFDVVFFVVILSALTQGWSLPLVARWTGVREASSPEAPVSLEINSIRHLDGDIVEYHVEEGALAAGRLVRELALPESAVVAMIARGNEVIPPRGSTPLAVGDFVFVVLKDEVRPLVDRMFAPRPTDEVPPEVVLDLPILGTTKVGELEDFYGVHLDPDPHRTLADLLAERLGKDLREGAEILAGELRLTVHRIEDGVVQLAGVEIVLGDGPEPR